MIQVGVSISEVFDTYIIALNKVQLGQDAMNAAFEDAGEQQKVLALMENYDSTKQMLMPLKRRSIKMLQQKLKKTLLN